MRGTPAIRGPVIAYWSESKEGTLYVTDVTGDDIRELTNVPRLGRILIHDKLDIIIAFGHFEKPSNTRSKGVSGLLANISIYDFSDPKALQKVPSSEHDKILKASRHTWLREGILRDQRLGTAAGFHMLNEGTPFLIRGSTLQAFAYATTVYLADMNVHGPKKMGVEDLAAGNYPRKAELLDICYQPENVESGSAFDATEEEVLTPRLHGDGKYVVQLGLAKIQIWSFDEDTELHGEDPHYSRCRTKAATARAEMRKQVLLNEVPCQSYKVGCLGNIC